MEFLYDTFSCVISNKQTKKVHRFFLVFSRVPPAPGSCKGFRALVSERLMLTAAGSKKKFPSQSTRALPFASYETELEDNKRHWIQIVT